MRTPFPGTIAAIFTLWLSGAALAQSDPVEMIQTTTGELFTLIEAHREEFPDDRERLYAGLKTIVGNRSDTLYSARLVLGRHGRGLEDAQVQAFADALSDLLMRRFGGGLLDFESRDQIEVLPLAGDNSDRMTRVRTRIALGNGDRAPVDYMVRKREGTWLIFDVIVEGISYVSTFRNQFAEEIRQNGFDATLERLQRGEIDVAVEGI